MIGAEAMREMLLNQPGRRDEGELAGESDDHVGLKPKKLVKRLKIVERSGIGNRPEWMI